MGAALVFILFVLMCVKPSIVQMLHFFKYRLRALAECESTSCAKRIEIDKRSEALKCSSVL